MGGIALACMARLGIEHFIIADIDHFEVSNLNRQIFASMDMIGKDKAEVSKNALLKINPNIKIELRNGNWVNELDEILKKMDVVVHGCDDIKCTVQLMRKCKEHKVPAIDAFASPLPNVYVIKPNDNRPEKVFGFPTMDLSIEKITKEIESACMQKEIEHERNVLLLCPSGTVQEVFESIRKQSLKFFLISFQHFFFPER